MLLFKLVKKLLGILDGFCVVYPSEERHMFNANQFWNTKHVALTNKKELEK